MKEVMAIIRLNRISQTKKALLLAGFPSMTCRKMLGRGKKKVDFALTKYVPLTETSPRMLEEISEEHRLVPKRFITLIVQDYEVKKAVDAIMDANFTGSPGDGKIFVLPVLEVYRVRTGETGVDAV